MRVFADHAYIKRQKKFWEDALMHLSKWIEEGNAIRPNNEWLVRHIVNNDIAMHVIFDNLSLICEVNWFEKLSDKTQYEVAGRLVRAGCETISITKEESKAHMDYTMGRIRAYTDCPIGERHALWIDGKDIPIDYAKIRSCMEAVAQIVHAMAIANGGLRYPKQELEYDPYPFTKEDAEKAVDELVAFVADFGEKVPENLRRYRIGQDKMEDRVRDIMYDTIAELMNCSADEKLDSDAMIPRCVRQFRRLHSGQGYIGRDKER